MRAEWQNLNGQWAFTFDQSMAQACMDQRDTAQMDWQITVPFPWGTPLSGVVDPKAEPENNFHFQEKKFLPPRTEPTDVGWYARMIRIPRKWRDKRIYLVIGASDYETEVFLDGRSLGHHRGGYTPFEFELPEIGDNAEHLLTVRVDDTWSKSRLYGKQEYGDVRGIWQTVYLEARSDQYIRSIHFAPNIKESRVRVRVKLDRPAEADETLRLRFRTGNQPVFNARFDEATLIKPCASEAAADSCGTDCPDALPEYEFSVPLQDQHLWDLDDPFLYEVTASLGSGDKLDTYFGQREIGTCLLPGTDYNYVSLNGKPVYLQLTLDQSYYPGGHYTFPSDEVMKNEILISKRLGLNGNRIHIKTEVPRKLYWADRLGLLIMADVPHFWGRPVPESRRDWEHCLRRQVQRDYNHPSIFAWVCFNETWGLTDSLGHYQPETQQWVASMYRLAKTLDDTRLVEDMSACRNDHVVTDINSWHAYRPGYDWEREIAMYCDSTYRGSTFNFTGGNRQADQPMMNSECGNVWGYYGSAGDCDYTWDYHMMLNSFRRHPRCAGWLYTEHHDVVREWNGYVRFDRSMKDDGLSDLVPGMSLQDLHSAYYISPDAPLCQDVPPLSDLEIPYYLSVMTDRTEGTFTLHTELVRYTELGDLDTLYHEQEELHLTPWQNGPAGTLSVSIPRYRGLYLLRIRLLHGEETVHRNFLCFNVKDAPIRTPWDQIALPFKPDSYTAAEWSGGTKTVLDSLKVNGLGHGFFEYTVTLPSDLPAYRIHHAELIFEASSRPTLGMDHPDTPDPAYKNPEYDPSRNPNAYHMTDAQLCPSVVEVSLNGKPVGRKELYDDPADHRGILSWASQPHDEHLREAGTYGQLVRIDLPRKAFRDTREVTLRFTVPEETGNGGLALYSRHFGRYPLDPTIIFHLWNVSEDYLDYPR
jgi:hypothetical protein